MRILMLVFLWIAAVVGVLLGGGIGGFTLFGPDAKDLRQSAEIISTWRQNAKNLGADGEKELAGLEEKLAIAHTYSYGGIAVALVSLALLISVLAKKSGAVSVLAGIGLLLAIALVVIVPTTKEKKGILGFSVPMAVAALCGFGADRKRQAASPQRAASLQLG